MQPLTVTWAGIEIAAAEAKTVKKSQIKKVSKAQKAAAKKATAEQKAKAKAEQKALIKKQKVQVDGNEKLKRVYKYNGISMPRPAPRLPRCSRRS